MFEVVLQVCGDVLPSLSMLQCLHFGLDNKDVIRCESFESQLQGSEEHH